MRLISSIRVNHCCWLLFILHSFGLHSQLARGTLKTSHTVRINRLLWGRIVGRKQWRNWEDMTTLLSWHEHYWAALEQYSEKIMTESCRDPAWVTSMCLLSIGQISANVVQQLYASLPCLVRSMRLARGYPARYYRLTSNRRLYNAFGISFAYKNIYYFNIYFDMPE